LCSRYGEIQDEILTQGSQHIIQIVAMLKFGDEVVKDLRRRRAVPTEPAGHVGGKYVPLSLSL